jgi:hypothetical protein
MTWIVAKIKWIMLLAGLVSCAAIWGAFEPRDAQDYMFDKALKGALADVIVRDWAVMLTLVGAMLIYGAFQVQHRIPVLIIACVSKLTFMGLMLWYGKKYIEEHMTWAMVAEGAMVAVFITFMIGMRRIGSGRFRHSAPSMSQQAMPPTPRTAVHIPPRPPQVAKTP